MNKPATKSGLCRGGEEERDKEVRHKQRKLTCSKREGATERGELARDKTKRMDQGKRNKEGELSQRCSDLVSKVTSH